MTIFLLNCFWAIHMIWKKNEIFAVGGARFFYVQEREAIFSHLIWFLLRVFIIRVNISIVIFFVSHHFIRYFGWSIECYVFFWIFNWAAFYKSWDLKSLTLKGVCVCVFWEGAAGLKTAVSNRRFDLRYISEFFIKYFIFFLLLPKFRKSAFTQHLDNIQTWWTIVRF